MKYCHFYEFRNITSVHNLVLFHFEQTQFFVMNLLPEFQMCVSFTSAGVVINDIAGFCCSGVLPQGRPCLTLLLEEEPVFLLLCISAISFLRLLVAEILSKLWIKL